MANLQNIFAILTYIFPLVIIIASKDCTYQCYNKGVTCKTRNGPPIQPQSVQEIQRVIRDAEAENITVKVIGSRHSISDSICTTGKVVILSNFKQFSFDQVSNLVTAGTGLETVDFLEKLHEVGCGISGAPTFGGVTLGGALAVGVHGTGIKFPTLLSDQVFSLSFVDGEGNLRNYTVNDDPKIFNAIKVSLGLLGIIYEAQFKCQPQYKLKMTNFLKSDNVLKDGAPELMEWIFSNDVIQMWWFPSNHRIVVSIGNRTVASAEGTCQTNFITNVLPALSNSFSAAIEGMQLIKDHVGLFLIQSYSKISLTQCVPGKQPFYSEPDGKSVCPFPATGWSHKMMSNKCTQCAWQTIEQSPPICNEDNDNANFPIPLTDDDVNVAIPLSNLPAALDVLRQVFDKVLVEFALNGIYFRFLKPGSGFMAINQGNAENDYWVSLEWITIPRWNRSQAKLGIKAYQLIPQILIKWFNGRPHWGKGGLVYTSPDIIWNSHGEDNLNSFITAMNKFDPNERFMNTFGQRIKYKKNVFTMDPNLAKRCALNEYCFCTNSLNCGTGTFLLDFTCEKVINNQFPVCQPTVVEEAAAEIQSATINTIAPEAEKLEFVISVLSKNYSLFTDGVLCGLGTQEIIS